MFLGTFTPKLDDKGRLTLPAKFRDELDEGLVVTKGLDHSLAVYPRDAFMVMAQKASATSRTNPESRAFVRDLAASADEQTLDSQGRISIPPALRSWAELKKECVVIGSMDYVEIWDAQSWQEYQENHQDTFAAGDNEVFAQFL